MKNEEEENTFLGVTAHGGAQVRFTGERDSGSAAFNWTTKTL